MSGFKASVYSSSITDQIMCIISVYCDNVHFYSGKFSKCNIKRSVQMKCYRHNSHLNVKDLLVELHSNLTNENEQ